MPARHPGHGGPGGVHRHAGAVHALRRGLHHLLQYHRQVRLSCYLSKIIDQASVNPTIFLVRIVRQHVIDADIISDILMTGNLFFALYTLYCKIKYAAATSSDAGNLCRHSFNEAVEYRSLITKVRASEDVPVILVANKVDLEQTMRSVQTAEGEALAEKFACPFYETSAAHRRHVDDVFHTLVREIR